MKCIAQSEKTKYSSPLEMFQDIYDKPTAELQKQLKEFKEHIKIYKEHYPLNKYEKM
jgi:hypothetical protein